MSEDNGGPAFPYGEKTIELDTYGGGRTETTFGMQPGMTLREYAAIKLHVPDSGKEWLDEIILQSLRCSFAAKAMQGFLAGMLADGAHYNERDSETVSQVSYQLADAMLEARMKND